MSRDELHIAELNAARREGFREGLGLALMFYGALFYAVEALLHGWPTEWFARVVCH